METVIGSGAEAILYKKDETVIKLRLQKKYRLNIIDEKLRKLRTRKEARILDMLEKAQIAAPKLLTVSDKEMKIEMSFINGRKMRDVITKELVHDLGKNIGKLHKKDIIHGDLTTSNMIVTEKGTSLIDFGLSFISKKIEDKAVDIHLFSQALESYHYEVHKDCFAEFVRGYKKEYEDAQKVLDRLAIVEKRGRNKK